MDSKARVGWNAWDSCSRCTREAWQGCCCLWKFYTVK